MRFQTVFFVICLIVSLAGCARLTSIHRDINVDSGTGAIVDMKQRVLLVSRQIKDGSKEKRTIVCAEPSPDALSAYAAEFAAEANIPNKMDTKLAAAFQESASFTGLRTQSIQLLRDGFYRMCEGYMSGAFDEIQYAWLMRRYQKNMVALLAIEQLTGAVRAPSVTINTQGSTEAARSISEMTDEIKKIDAEIIALEAKKNDEKDEARKKELENQIKTQKEKKENIKNTRGLVASGSATSAVSTSGLPNRPSDETIKALADAVKDIVLRIYKMDDRDLLCYSYLHDLEKKDDAAKPNKASSEVTLATICRDHFKNENDNDKNEAATRNEVIKEWIKKSNSISDEIIKMILGLPQEKNEPSKPSAEVKAAKEETK